MIWKRSSGMASRRQGPSIGRPGRRSGPLRIARAASGRGFGRGCFKEVTALRTAFIAMLIVLQLICPARADAKADEIAYLLKYIRESPCTFIRNGSEYDGAAAADHV